MISINTKSPPRCSCFLPVLITEGHAKDWVEFANKDVTIFWHLSAQMPLTSDSGSDLWATVRVEEAAKGEPLLRPLLGGTLTLSRPSATARAGPHPASVRGKSCLTVSLWLQNLVSLVSETRDGPGICSLNAGRKSKLGDLGLPWWCCG